jgi:hypothetical protein
MSPPVNVVQFGTSVVYLRVFEALPPTGVSIIQVNTVLSGFSTVSTPIAEPVRVDHFGT